MIKLEITLQKDPCFNLSLSKEEFLSLYSITRKLLDYENENKVFDISEDESSLINWLDIIVTQEFNSELNK